MKIYLPVAVSEDHDTTEGVVFRITDQPRKHYSRPIFSTPFSELADWLCTTLNAHPGPTIDTDLVSPQRRPDPAGQTEKD